LNEDGEGGGEREKERRRRRRGKGEVVISGTTTPRRKEERGDKRKKRGERARNGSLPRLPHYNLHPHTTKRKKLPNTNQNKQNKL